VKKPAQRLAARRTAALSRVPRSRQAGFTLIEVMVALIVLVLGVLGAAAMTLNSLRDNKQSGLRSQATALAYEMGDLMRANPTFEATFTGTPPSPTAVTSSCYTTGCAPSDMATSDYAQWVAKLTSTTAPVYGLPNATWKICRDAANLTSMTACDNLATSPLMVKLKWDEKYNNGTFVADQSGNSNKPNLVLAMEPY
jgi:type IV pilus assembly protein PilV